MQANLKQYLYILEEGITDEVGQYFQQAKFERLQIFCALAAYHTAEGRNQRDRNARTEQFARAAQLLGSARQIDYEDQLPLLGLGQLELARVSSFPGYKERDTCPPKHGHFTTYRTWELGSMLQCWF